MISHWSQSFERFLRAVLPVDFPPAVPIYILSDGETAGRYTARRDCMAFVSHHLDLQMRDILQGQGRWRGRGFATIVCRQIFDRFPNGWNCGNGARQLRNTLLHESGHYFETAAQWAASVEIEEIPPGAREMVAVDGWMFADMQTAANTVVDPPAGVDAGQRFAKYLQNTHGWRFFRSMFHVHARANAAGYCCSLGELNADPVHYGRSTEAFYRLAMGDEIDRCREMPIKNTMQTEPPEAFRSVGETEEAAA